MEPVLNQALKAEHVGFVTDTFMSRGMRFPTMWYVCLFDLILYVHSTIFQLCGTCLPGLNQY